MRKDWLLQLEGSSLNLQEKLKATMVANLAVAAVVMGYSISILTYFQSLDQKLMQALLNMALTSIYFIPILIIRYRKNVRLASILFLHFIYLGIQINLFYFLAAEPPRVYIMIFMALIALAHFTLGMRWSLYFTAHFLATMGAILWISVSGIELERRIEVTTGPKDRLLFLLLGFVCLGFFLYILRQYSFMKNQFQEILSKQNQENLDLLAKQRKLNEVILKREAELVEAVDKAEKATEAKGAFLSSMSHEIRTPLNGILGITSLLNETKLDEEQEELVQVLQRSNDNLLHLINNILDYSKIESGNLSLNHSWFHLSSPIEDTLALLSNKAFENKLELIYQLDPKADIWVRSDQIRLMQVLLNLLQNAIKFTPKGQVGIYVKVINVKFPFTTLQFEVRDSGVGIPASQQEKIFQVFQQIEDTDHHHTTGTGLGLPISKQIIELMKGDLWVESEEGKGSSFFFTVRLESKRPSSKQLSQRHRFPRVFVKVNNQELSHSLVEQLTSWNFESTYIEELHDLSVFPQDKKSILLLEETQFNGYQDTLGKLHPLVDKGLLSIVKLQKKRFKQATIPSIQIETSLPMPVNPLVLRDRLVDLTTPSHSLPKPNFISQPRKNDPFPSSLSVLLVDDNTVNQTIAKKMLCAMGYTPSIASNGKEAVGLAVSHDFDLILMDCKMPEMDGYTATRLIREGLHDKGRSSIIIALTANALPGDREKCLASGMDDFLPKPIKKSHLEDIIQKWFE
ncbi:MAG: ATP-binding protein [Bacteroidota bacterium]